MSNNISSVEQAVGMTMISKALKKELGDGMEFEIVYQSLLSTMQEQTSQENASVVNPLNVGIGQELNSLPILYGSSQLYNLSGVTVTNKVYTDSTNETTKRIYNAVNKYSEEFGVDPKLVLAVIKAESNFNPNVVSHAGAMGLMQLMPINCKEDGVGDPFNIEENIRGGVKQLKGHINRYNGNIEMALMAYNAGQGRVKQRGVTSPADLYKMPKETQNYVPKVMNYYKNGF